MPNFYTLLLSILTGIVLIPTFLAEEVSAKAGSSVSPQTSSIMPMAQVPRSRILLAQNSNFNSFFEEGRSLSENRLRRQPPDPTIPVAQNSQSWQPVFFRAGGFSFWMPPGTLSEDRVVLPTQAGEVSFRTLSAHSETARYVVGYAEQLTSEQLKNPQNLLTAIVNKVVPSQKFTIVRNQPVTQAGVQGRELSYQSDSEVIVFRAFLRRNTAYVIGARSPKNIVYEIGARSPESGGIPPRQTTIFLNSFDFLSE